MARNAPTAAMSQLLHWTLAGTREKVHRLSGFVIDWAREMVAQKDPIAIDYETSARPSLIGMPARMGLPAMRLRWPSYPLRLGGRDEFGEVFCRR